MSAAKSMADSGFAPVRIYGVNPDGSCKCGNPDCKPKNHGKHPVGAGWQNQPIDGVAVDAWVAAGGNVGWRMGAQPNGKRLIALDEDEAGSFERAEDKLGPLPPTLTSRSGSGVGGHRVFEWPAAKPLPKGRVKALPGIDVRSQGGQIVVEPSRHKSGGTYAWLRGNAPGIAVLPDAWCSALLADKPKSASPTQSESRAALDLVKFPAPKCLPGVEPAAHAVTICKGHPPGVQGANGHGALLGLARALVWGLALEPERAAALAWDHYNPRCMPPWTRDESDDFGRKFTEARDTPDPGNRPRGYLLPPAVTDVANLPALVCDTRGSQFWFRRGADNLFFSPVAKGVLPARAREAGAESGKAEDIAARATIAEVVVRDFAASGIEWHDDERAIVQGYAPPKVVPVFDARADAWLRAIAGHRYEFLAQWFAACTQAHIRSLAACLVLIGDTGLGKTLIAIVASRMWGATAPVSLEHAIDRFNASITKCPIVLDDEATRMKQGDVSTSAFREMLSARERSYEPKGVDKRELRGCQRFMITCNGFTDLRFSDVGSSAVVEALADRLLVVRVPRGEQAERVRKALDALRLEGTDDVDLAVIDRHVAWVVSQTEAKPQRFLASPGRDDRDAQQAILDSIVQQHEDLFDKVRDAIERGELDDLREPPPVFVHGGVVWVRGNAGGGGLTAGQVYQALAPWALEPRRAFVKLRGQSVRARAHDLDRLRGAL